MTSRTAFRRAPLALLACLALGVPSAAAISQDMVSQPVVQPVPPSFADSFPTVPEADRSAEAEPGAVDVTEIDPPIEVIETPAARPFGSGIASYYGRRFHGRRTANGERFDMYAMTAAHRTLPFGTLVEVTNPRNGRTVVVRINDRGPFTGGREIDLSRAAAERIGLVRRGHGRVDLAIVESD